MNSSLSPFRIRHTLQIWRNFFVSSNLKKNVKGHDFTLDYEVFVIKLRLLELFGDKTNGEYIKNLNIPVI